MSSLLTLQQLLPKSKPVCAATVRLGPGFLDVPFFGTQKTQAGLAC